MGNKSVLKVADKEFESGYVKFELEADAPVQAIDLTKWINFRFDGSNSLQQEKFQ